MVTSSRHLAVHEDFPSVVSKLSVQEPVDGPEVEEEHEDVGHLAADELEEVPAVVMQNGFEIFDVLLDHGLEDYPVVVFVFFLEHDGRPENNVSTNVYDNSFNSTLTTNNKISYL